MVSNRQKNLSRNLSWFSASEVLYDENNKVVGIATCDMGRLKDGSEGPNFERGIESHKQTIFSEGCRGHLGKTLMEKFNSIQITHHKPMVLELKNYGSYP